ncbi:MAG TPA: VacB/RNase II family 3'-5' exoribonuclease [Kiritimatiellia bacterium]|nr:VacB/RNase II family 3'-5' exoribonuclease [Kiritimatiellia bacterium]HRZ12017.1 VacB/RNase II family 3'-5' exoribonuclease [Kiritimatiellia bacterium]HSA17177.1 VacB/RNase II family 3'-5' exoribonuclease [Kiritimatiellia bacterium]
MAEFTPSERKRILDFLHRPDYRPLRQHELARALAWSGPVLRRALRDMEREGLIVRLRKNRWAAPRGAPTLAGRLRVSVDGFGFVTPEQTGRPDIYIPAESLGPALDGDRVLIALSTEGEVPDEREARTRGRVVRVLERRHERVVGRLRRTAYYGYVIPDNPRIRENVRVRGFAPGLAQPEEDRLVVVDLEPREREQESLSGTVVEDLGPADAPGADMLSVMRSFDVRSEFPAEALRQADHESPAPAPALFHDRHDLRGQLVFTIDPEDAKDFDDAVSLVRADDGRWRLGVHIADVSRYVPVDSPVDVEARRRGTSVYLADRVIPMLPPRLTTDVCSLQPGVPRLTHSVFILFDPLGGVLDFSTGPSVIRSAARLDYDQVQACFDGGAGGSIPAEVRASLAEMRELAALLRRRRMAEGSLDLAMPEIRCRMDSAGRVLEIRKRGSTEAYQLIEEFMLAANQAVAGRIARQKAPSLYRIHDEPDAAQWERMQVELRALGLASLPPRKDTLSRLARLAAASPMSYAAQLAILRNLKRAVYAPVPGLHFGLGFDCYTHFTSPIRRYPDLVVHRVLKALETRAAPPYSADDTARLATHCSQTEAQADEAESDSIVRKRLDYYHGLMARDETGPFEGVIIGLHARGLVVELRDTLQRGHLPFSALPEDHYVTDRDRMKITGRRRDRSWRVGQEVRVRLARVDARRRSVGLLLEEASADARTRRREKRRQRMR